MKKSLRILIFLVAVALAHSVVMAQQPTASLTGVVTDPNGAVIAGASVTATNTVTNLSRTATTNNEGIYTIPNLPVGQYEIKFGATGFRTFNRTVSLNVGQTLSVDGNLEVGNADYFAVVSQVLVDTQASKVDAVINDKTIENLPLNGRNFLELALLTPGNSPAPNFDPTKTNTVVISSAGQVGRGGNVMFFAADGPDQKLAIPLTRFWNSQPSILFSYGAAPRDMSEALDHIASGRVRVDGLVTHRFPLNRIGEAFDLVANPRDTSLKIIIEPHRRG